MTTYSINLDEIRQRAHDRANDFDIMLHTLEFRAEISDEALDALVERVAQPIIHAIDCTQCANCCRSLHVYLTPEDSTTLANFVGLDEIAFDDQYINHDEAHVVGEWGRFADRPCRFLQGSLCGVYSHRPETCRTYPMLTPDFRWMLTDLIEGTSVCPIIFHTLDAMERLLDQLDHHLDVPPAN